MWAAAGCGEQGGRHSSRKCHEASQAPRGSFTSLPLPLPLHPGHPLPPTGHIPSRPSAALSTFCSALALPSPQRSLTLNRALTWGLAPSLCPPVRNMPSPRTRSRSGVAAVPPRPGRRDGPHRGSESLPASGKLPSTIQRAHLTILDGQTRPDPKDRPGLVPRACTGYPP